MLKSNSAVPLDPADDALALVVRPIRHETLRQRVYEQLRTAVTRGLFSPVQAVTVRALAASLGVSPTPVREALQMLTAEAALVVEPNKAYRVPVMSRAQLAELREVRAALEGLAAEKAAEKITPEELERLEEADGRSIAAIERKDTKAYLAANEEFHFILYDAARSPVLNRMIRMLWLQIGPSLNLLFKDVSLVRDLGDNHRRAIAAMRGGDMVSAREAIRRDVLTAAAFIQQHLPEAGETKAASHFSPKG